MIFLGTLITAFLGLCIWGFTAPEQKQHEPKKKVHPYKIHQSWINWTQSDIKFLQDRFDEAMELMKKNGTAYLNNDKNRDKVWMEMLNTYSIDEGNEAMALELIYVLQDSINFRYSLMSGLAYLNGNPMSNRDSSNYTF